MSATMPLFSVIVPVYNVAPYLAECLDSVLSQSCADWECFCVDDGSRDGSGSLLDVYARRDARFRITHQPNAGVSSARNRALDTTYGQWVWFVDGDDAIHPEALAVLSETIASYPEVQAIAFRQALVRWEPFRFRPLSEMRKTAFGMKAFSQTVWILLFQRKQIGKRRFPAYCVGEDGLFSIGYYLGISKWVDTALPLYYYRTRENSVMHTRPTERFLLDWLDMLYARVCLLSPRDVISMGGGRGLFRRVAGACVVHARLRALSFAGGSAAAIASCVASPCRCAQCRSSLSLAAPLGLLSRRRDPFAAVAQSPRRLAGLCPHSAWRLTPRPLSLIALSDLGVFNASSLQEAA